MRVCATGRDSKLELKLLSQCVGMHNSADTHTHTHKMHVADATCQQHILSPPPPSPYPKPYNRPIVHPLPQPLCIDLPVSYLGRLFLALLIHPQHVFIGRRETSLLRGRGRGGRIHGRVHRTHHRSNYRRRPSCLRRFRRSRSRRLRWRWCRGRGCADDGVGAAVEDVVGDVGGVWDVSQVGEVVVGLVADGHASFAFDVVYDRGRVHCCGGLVT